MTNPTIKFLDRNPPQIPIEEAQTIARELFQLEGIFTPLKSERDQNFRIETGQGDQYVLKISNSDEVPGVIDFQTQALLHIAAQDPTLPVPRVLRTQGGHTFETITSAVGTSHIVHCLTYLPGTILGDLPQTMARWNSLGQLMGRLDVALRGFFHPHARHELLWDVTRCVDLRPHIEHIEDEATQRQLETILDRMATDILPRLKRLRHQVIHSDAHAHNLLGDPSQPDTITGILDFGDMVYNPLVAEIAITADVDGLTPEDMIDSLCHLTAGFDQIIPLEEDEIDLIYDLVLARMATTIIIIAWRKAMTPDQAGYLLDEEKVYWDTMSHLFTMDRVTVQNQLRQACRFPPYCPVNTPSPALKDEREGLLARRQKLLGQHLSMFYNEPFHVERGQGPWLYNAQGKAYLDAYNNVPVVGHCHPHVVKAITRQASALNTNTRYIYRAILDYAERLTGYFDGDLSVCLFVNSGSEANDIAWRIAQFMTGQRGALVMDYAYHGITEAITHLSPEELPAEVEMAPHVQTLRAPDPYRDQFPEQGQALLERYAVEADQALTTLEQRGFKPAAFMIDTTFLSNGAPDVPAGYVEAVAAKVRTAGGLIIADEVQAGFGRAGTHMWGHQAHGVQPDLVTIGKPVGNGYPLGVVVTTPEILNAFVEATGLFSTFGGNPVGCAAGLAVLDVIEREALLPQALATGDYLRTGIRALMSKHHWIGDVRGRGLLAGVELVRNRETQEPAKVETLQVLRQIRDAGVLIGKTGPFGNVLKIRPSLVFQEAHVDLLVEALDQALTSLGEISYS
ncbi:MAG: aminotransferase class III-fold pyridoxal phosphate-dependent enzyme [Chloroflexota bacterium]